MKKQFSRSLGLFSVIVSVMMIFSLSASAKTVTSGDFVFETISSGAILKEYKGNAATVEIPSEADSFKVTEIASQAFGQNKTVKSIVIPGSVSKIEKDAFAGCENLTAYVTEGSYAEEYIKGLANVRLAYRYIKEMKLNYSSLKVGLTAERQITATFTPTDIYSDKLSYKTSDKNIVTVSSDGKIKAVGIGKAVITVTTTDGSNISQKINVTVNPQKVKTLKKTSSASDSVSLTWSKITKATGYKLYKYNDAKKAWECITTTTKTTFTDKNVKIGDTAKYKVRAYTKLSSTYYGEYSSVLTVAMPKPGTVTGLEAASAENYTKLTWKKADTANGYRVYLFDTKTNKFVKKVSTTALNAKITGLSPNTEYKFAVQAYYKPTKGDVVFGDKQIEITTATRPVSVSALTYDKNAVYFDRVTLSWKASTDITGYEIYILNNATKEAKAKKVGANETTAVISALSSNTEYTFKIRAYTQRESGAVYSYYSSAVNVKTHSLPSTNEAAFNSFIEALSNTKGYENNAILYKDVLLKDFSGDKNDTVLSNIATVGTNIHRFKDGKTADGKDIASYIGTKGKDTAIKIADINAQSVKFKANGSGYDITFTLYPEGPSAEKTSLFTSPVDWNKIKETANGFSLISCRYTGTTVTAKVQDGLVSYMEVSMPVEVSFKTGLTTTYSFTQTIVTTTAFVTV